MSHLGKTFAVTLFSISLVYVIFLIVEYFLLSSTKENYEVVGHKIVEPFRKNRISNLFRRDDYTLWLHDRRASLIERSVLESLYEKIYLHKKITIIEGDYSHIIFEASWIDDNNKKYEWNTQI